MQEMVLKGMDKDFRSNEAYKTLRTNIEFSGADNKVIVFTSCTPNEGKSTVSLSVSSSLAEAGKKVLFIDADLRKSVLAGRQKVTGTIKGLSHFLAGQAEVGDIMYKTQKAGLVVMFAGVVPPNPAELLGHKRFENLISSARKVYDYILIDTPPIISMSDAAIAAKQCDGAILVIESEAVSRRDAMKAKEQLTKSGCKLLGAVLNKVDMKKEKYYSKYNSYYYGKSKQE